MVLVQVEVVGLQTPQTLLDQRHGAVVGVIVTLGGQKDLVAPLPHHAADVQFTGTVAVQGRGIDIVDAQIERPVDDFDRLVVAVVHRGGEQSAQAVNGYLVSGLAEWSLGNGFGRRFGCRGHRTQSR